MKSYCTADKRHSVLLEPARRSDPHLHDAPLRPVRQGAPRQPEAKQTQANIL